MVRPWAEDMREVAPYILRAARCIPHTKTAKPGSPLEVETTCPLEFTYTRYSPPFPPTPNLQPPTL